MRTRTWLVAVVVMGAALSGAPAMAGVAADSTGVVDQTTGVWYLRDGSSGKTTSFYYGNPGDYPIMGDWDCNGSDTPGLYRQSDGYVYLRNSNSQGIADIRFFFGNPGDMPLAGDFNKDGCDTVSIYRPSEARIYVINKLGSNDGGLGAADYDFYFGNPGDKPFTGDFNNNGQDTVGLHRETTGFVYYRNTLTTGIADNDFFYGDPGDQIITGRWVQDPTKGPDTVGIYRPSNAGFYLRFENSQGNANVDYAYGNSNMAAVAGAFGSLPGTDPAPPCGSLSGSAVLDFGDSGTGTADVTWNGRQHRVPFVGTSLTETKTGFEIGFDWYFPAGTISVVEYADLPPGASPSDAFPFDSIVEVTSGGRGSWVWTGTVNTRDSVANIESIKGTLCIDI